MAAIDGAIAGGLPVTAHLRTLTHHSLLQCERNGNSHRYILQKYILQCHEYCWNRLKLNPSR